jgi:hypothetical protein
MLIFRRLHCIHAAYGTVTLYESLWCTVWVGWVITTKVYTTPRLWHQIFCGTDYFLTVNHNVTILSPLHGCNRVRLYMFNKISHHDIWQQVANIYSQCNWRHIFNITKNLFSEQWAQSVILSQASFGLEKKSDTDPEFKWYYLLM